MVEVTGWSVNPDRTAIAVVDSGAPRRIACWSLDESGRVTAPLDSERFVGWDLLGWASPSLLALWRRHADGSELEIVDTSTHGADPVRHKLMGRPIRCDAGRAGDLEVLVAISDGRRTRLGLHRPRTRSYLLADGAEDFTRIDAWDSGQGLLAVRLETGVRLYRYTEEVCTEIGIPVTPNVRLAGVTDLRAGLLGVTGLDQAGRTVPGLIDLSTSDVRWFGDHADWSCAEISLSGKHILATAWADEQHTYRVLDTDGNQVGGPVRAPGLATELSFTRDEAHLIGCHQSPVLAPALVAWTVRDGTMRPLWTEPVRRPACEASWELRWWTDPSGQQVPEWVFQPPTGAQRGTVLLLHGGPGGQLKQAYDPLIVALLRAGRRVVGMNYPGSSGYGAEFEAVSRADWGGGDAKAIEHRLRSLRAEPGGHPLHLYGQSYGAYLALLTDPRIVDGIAVWAPVTNLVRLLADASGVQRRWLEHELGAMRLVPSRLWQRSPVSRVAGLGQVPLLIGHGGLDDRCPVEQSRLLAERLPGARFLEDPSGTHAPSSWEWWTEAVVAHFEQATVAGRRPALTGGELS